MLVAGTKYKLIEGTAVPIKVNNNNIRNNNNNTLKAESYQIRFIVASCIMEPTYCPLTNKYTIY